MLKHNLRLEPLDAAVDRRFHTVSQVKELEQCPMEFSENPYASPTAELTGPSSIGPEVNNAEVIRRKYLNHEASVQSVGILYWIGSIVLFLGTLGIFFAEANDPHGFALALLIGLVYLGLAVLGLWLGYGFRKLDSRVRIPAGILAAIGLLAIGLGTLINLYILYLLFCAKGKMVFSPEYKEIIQQTPHIKYRTSLIVWIFFFFLLALMGLGIGSALFSVRADFFS